MDDNGKHIRELEKKVSALSDALAHLGKGTTLQELLRIIRFPGYTTPAEYRSTSPSSTPCWCRPMRWKSWGRICWQGPSKWWRSSERLRKCPWRRCVASAY